MKSFFKKSGPFDINFLISKTIYSKKKKFAKQQVCDISSLEHAKSKDITFFNNLKYIYELNKSKASFCFIEERFVNLVKNKKIKLIISSKPLLDFILICKIFYKEADTDHFKFNINPKYSKLKTKYNSLVDKSVKIGKNFLIGMNSVIKKNVIIGNNVTIGSNCVISNSIIGDNVIVNDGSIIGKIGFGFKFINNKIHFIPHIGYVKIEKNVYIGSNCSIDRGSFSNTSIGLNTMIDNQVHIAHNVNIGSNCFIAGQVGIAGSTKIGNNCLIGGKSGISGHLSIGNNVYIGGQSGVLKNIKSGSKVMGYPSTPIKNFVRKMKHD